MTKKIIIYSILLGLLIFGIRACYMQDYETVLRYPNENCKIIISPDSNTIALSFYVRDATTLGVFIDFESVKDSLLIKDLIVAVTSSDNPEQSITLKNVSTVIHPVSTTSTGGLLERLYADKFEELPLNAKVMTNSGLPYNSVMFNFRSWQIWRTGFYNFKVSGKIIYKGAVFDFEREIKTERKVEYHPYRMMT